MSDFNESSTVIEGESYDLNHENELTYKNMQARQVSQKEIMALKKDVEKMGLQGDVKKEINEVLVEMETNHDVTSEEFHEFNQEVRHFYLRDPNNISLYPSKLNQYILKYVEPAGSQLIDKNSLDENSTEQMEIVIEEILNLVQDVKLDQNGGLSIGLGTLLQRIKNAFPKDKKRAHREKYKLFFALSDFFEDIEEDEIYFNIQLQGVMISFSIHRTALDLGKTKVTLANDDLKTASNSKNTHRVSNKQNGKKSQSLSPTPEKKKENIQKQSASHTQVKNHVQEAGESIEKYAKELNALGFIATKEGVIRYQVDKGLIANKHSSGAGFIGEKTRISIEKSYQLLLIAQHDFKTPKSRILLREEYGNKDFLLSSFLAKNSMPESVERLCFTLLCNKLEGKSIFMKEKKVLITREFLEAHKVAILTNFSKVMQILLEIESHGGKKYAKSPKSSAQGYFQYIRGVKHGKQYGMYDPRDPKKAPPFHVGLSRLREVSKDVPEYLNVAFENPLEIGPIDLTAEQSMNVFVADFFAQMDKKNYSLQKIFEGFIQGQESHIQSLYKLHYGGTIAPTLKLKIKKIVLAYNDNENKAYGG